MKRLLIAWLLLTTALFGAWQIASAQMLMPIVNFGGPRAAYQGPGDIYSTSIFGWWGLRAYSLAKAGNKAASVCDVSTGLVCSDIYTLANGNFDVATASGLTQCASSCNIATLYEQSGGGGPNLTQATNSARPVLTFNCIGSLPCLTFTRASSMVLAGTITGFSPPATFTAVVERTTNTTNFQGATSFTAQSTGLEFVNSANTMDGQWSGSAANLDITAADSSLHSAVYANASLTSCLINIDGTTASAVTSCGGGSSGTSLGFGAFDANYLGGKMTEGGLWKAAVNSTQAGQLCHNGASYYGISGATC